MVLLPNVKWAQRKDKLFLTIDIQDCKSPDVKLTNEGPDGEKHGHLSFRGKGEGADPEPHEYGLDLDFFAAIDVDGSKVAANDRGVVLIVAKEDKDAEEHWPRLLKASGKAPANVKIDWDRWQDEDEEAESLASGFGGDDGGFGGMDFSSLMGGAGGGGFGGMMGGDGGGFDMSSLQGLGGEDDFGGGGDDGEDDDYDDDDEGKDEDGEEESSDTVAGKGDAVAAPA